MLHDVVQRKKFYTLVLQKCLTRSPPYTPEMNPIEQVWAEIRKRGFKNRVFKTLDEVIDKLQSVIQVLHWSDLKTIVQRKWTSAIFDFG